MVQWLRVHAAFAEEFGFQQLIVACDFIAPEAPVVPGLIRHMHSYAQISNL